MSEPEKIEKACICGPFFKSLECPEHGEEAKAEKGSIKDPGWVSYNIMFTVGSKPFLLPLSPGAKKIDENGVTPFLPFEFEEETQIVEGVEKKVKMTASGLYVISHPSSSSAPSGVVYYDKEFVANLKAQTPFASWMKNPKKKYKEKKDEDENDDV